MDEEAECQLNLDQAYQRDIKTKRYETTETEFEIKIRKLISRCDSFQLCQNWKTLSQANDPLCDDLMFYQCVDTRNRQICEILFENYLNL